MNCIKCQAELPAEARFCPNCGTPVPRDTSIRVEQEIEDVSGEVVGTILGGDGIPAGLDSNTIQRIDRVGSGGSVVGTILGDKGNIHVGGQQQYGDTVQNKQEIYTGGGTFVDGSVNTGGGDFVGRDQHVEMEGEHGAQASGDLSRASNIPDSPNDALGPGVLSKAAGSIDQEIEQLFVPVMALVHHDSPESQGPALQAVAALKAELAKGKAADDAQIAELLDSVVEFVPGAESAIVSAFASSLLEGVTGPVTKFVLDKIQGK
jgi:hypothetical protein